jgi:hypothetical protein
MDMSDLDARRIQFFGKFFADTSMIEDSTPP